MSTPAIIGIKQNDNTYKTVSVHWDGYLSCTGAILLEYYNNTDIINTLIDFGNISSLGSELYPDTTKPHNSKQFQEDVTLFYGRDYGYLLTAPKIYNTLDEITDNKIFTEYFYVFTDGKWFYKITDVTDWKELTIEDCNEENDR